MSIKGIDISHYQADTQFHEVKASGVEFVYLKATEALATDSTYVSYRSAALSVGLCVGSYHFYRYKVSWAAQAHHFCEVVGQLRPGELPPVIDLEDEGGLLSVGIPAATRQTLAFIEAVSFRLGKPVTVYADASFVGSYLQESEFAQHALWLAKYTSSQPKPPKPWKQIMVWQNSEHGTCPGVNGEVDTDLYLGDTASLYKWAGKV